MDPLSHIIALLKPSAALSKPIAARGDWGVRYAAYGHPGFAMVLTGRCWLEVEGTGPLLLERGDFVLMPSTPAFAMFSRPGVACVTGQPAESAIRYGDPEGPPDFEMLGGAFRIEPFNGPLLLALLPEVIHIRAADGDTGRLSAIIDLIMEESAAERPGREMIMERLLEVMLVECLRRRGIGGGAMPPGLLSGMRDSALAKALRAMHSDVRSGWTVAELARIAGMSRSAFSARFGEALGCAPIEYLLRWRMVLAQDALCCGASSLDRLAEEIGYESASAFSTAFRRRIGTSPGAFARARRQGAGGALRMAGP